MADKLYTYRYPHPAVTTDCCIFSIINNELSILLVLRGIPPYQNTWALPGGFMNIDESAEQCALRELREETGFTAERIRQFHTYTTVERDPRERVITIAFYALVKSGRVRGGDDATDARWFPVRNLPKLAFDHHEIIKDALSALKRDIYFEPIGFELLPDTFSMAELQKIIESITGEKYDRRNFYNKMRHTRMVEEISQETPLMMADCSCPTMSDEAEELLKDSVPTRRRGLKYIFNRDAFNKRKDEKGGTPYSF